MPKHIFFDLDKTLTKSRSPMDAEHQKVFYALLGQKDVVVVSGGSAEQIREQVTASFDNKYFILAQSGNDAIDKDGSQMWSEQLSPEQMKAIEEFVEVLKKDFPPAQNPEDILEHRGAQTSYSVVGFHADVAVKYAFDPDDKKRAEALRNHSKELEQLRSFNVDVTPAGTTTYNFIETGKHKGANVERLCKREGWDKKDCVYVGDALFPGGNDETVIGVIPTHAVTSPDETFEFVKTLLV